MLQRLADGDDDDAPTFVLYLLTTRLDNLLEAFDDCALVSVVAAL